MCSKPLLDSLRLSYCLFLAKARSYHQLEGPSSKKHQNQAGNKRAKVSHPVTSDEKIAEIKLKKTGQPWNMDPYTNAGWKVRTEVKKSTIPQAGKGRSALHVFVQSLYCIPSSS